MLLNGVAHIISFKNGYLTFWDFQELIPDLFSVLIRNGESYKVQLFVYKFVFTWVILNVILVFMFYLFKGLKFCGVFNTWIVGSVITGCRSLTLQFCWKDNPVKLRGYSLFISLTNQSSLIQAVTHYLSKPLSILITLLQAHPCLFLFKPWFIHFTILAKPTHTLERTFNHPIHL